MKYLLSFVSLFLVTLFAAAQGESAKLTVENVQVNPGGTATVTAHITGATQFNAAGMYVEIPEGMTFVYDAEEESYIVGGSVFAKSHGVSDNLMTSQVIKFAITSLKNVAFQNDEGTLFSFTISCSANVADGVYTGYLKTIEFSRSEAVGDGLHVMDDIPFNIIVGDAPLKYTATFIADGRVVSSDSLSYGDTITVPDAPEKWGYTFVSWGNVSETMPAHDVQYTAEYTPNVYRLRFFADGKLVSEDSLAYGTPITQPAPVEKEGYTFVSWGNVASAMPSQDLTYTARYIKNYYKVEFIAGSKVVSSDSLSYGDTITVPDAPEKTGHTFVSWGDVSETMPAHDVRYTAEYTPNVYRLRFFADGKLVSEDSLAYGTPITQPAPVEKEGYTFVSWGNVANAMPAQDLTYTAIYIPNVVYRLRFFVDGKLVSEDSLAYGTPITQPSPVEKEGYTFVSWGDVSETMPAHDVQYTAHYVINKYRLTFMLDNEVHSSGMVEYASVIDAPDVPEREGYVFNGWTGLPLTMPATDLTIEGSYRPSAELTVSDPDGSLREFLMQSERIDEVKHFAVTGRMQADDYNALLLLENIEELTLPKADSREASFSLGSLSKLLVVYTTSPETFMGDEVFEGCNPNLMVYAPEGASVGTQHCNVIIDGRAENIRLTDGRPVRIPTAFFAHQAEYRRSFSKPTVIGQGSGWETLVLPFYVSAVEAADGRKLTPFGTLSTDETRHFWLAKMGSNGFELTTEMYANVPYIIAMPNNSTYTDGFNVTGEVIFRSNGDVLVHTTEAEYQEGMYTFTPLYEPDGSTAVFTVNNDEVQGYAPGSVFIRGLRAARPFEAYITLPSGARQRDILPIQDMADATDINVVSGVGASSQGVYYTLSGRRVSHPSSPGIYIVRSGTAWRKVVIK